MSDNKKNMERLARARKIIANNPEDLLIEAAAAGDKDTVKRLLEHTIDLPRSRIRGSDFIILRDDAYNAAFAAAANNMQADCVKVIFDYAGHKVDSFAALSRATYMSALVDPDENPDAEDIMNLILDRKGDILPKELKETATRLRNAYREDLKQAKHIRENFSQFLSFYVVKEEVTTRAKDKNNTPTLINKLFNQKDDKKSKNKTKKRPDYLKPV